MTDKIISHRKNHGNMYLIGEKYKYASKATISGIICVVYINGCFSTTLQTNSPKRIDNVRPIFNFNIFFSYILEVQVFHFIETLRRLYLSILLQVL